MIFVEEMFYCQSGLSLLEQFQLLLTVHETVILCSRANEIKDESLSSCSRQHANVDILCQLWVIKSVMDIAQEKKDHYKEYAAFMSANLLFDILAEEQYSL